MLGTVTGRLVVVDTTNVQKEARKPLVALARHVGGDRRRLVEMVGIDIGEPDYACVHHFPPFGVLVSRTYTLRPPSFSPAACPFRAGPRLRSCWSRAASC